MLSSPVCPIAEPMNRYNFVLSDEKDIVQLGAFLCPKSVALLGLFELSQAGEFFGLLGVKSFLERVRSFAVARVVNVYLWTSRWAASPSFCVRT